MILLIGADGEGEGREACALAAQVRSQRAGSQTCEWGSAAQLKSFRPFRSLSDGAWSHRVSFRFVWAQPQAGIVGRCRGKRDDDAGA